MKSKSREIYKRLEFWLRKELKESQCLSVCPFGNMFRVTHV